ncbi:serine protease [Pendulispora rubella]|uniref:Serine protease n=1 Tax=Pendulispora rubella TaxID=2741070 RepID=A0ABZ2L2R4_9BACT
MLTRLFLFAAVASLSLGAAACGSSSSEGEENSTRTACAGLRIVDPSLRTQSQCGPTLDFTPINDYHGDIPSIQEREDAVVLINGACTGTLIAAQAGPIILTAGHCGHVGDRVMLAFNVEANADGDTLVTEGAVVEQADAPDYALIKPDKLPVVTPTPLTTKESDRLAIIQHPRGGPKSIAEGKLAGVCNGLIYYTDLDTLVGGSGAGVLTRDGYLVGVHTDGDCAADGSGSNYGWTSVSIVAASAYLQDADIAAR